jgi:ER-bound oxygenase mpaB/B'/Rubber oxygenase, catalytic domain
MGRVTHDWLDALSRQGDAEADAVIDAHAAWSQEVVGGDIVRHIAAHLHLPDEKRSPAVHDYLSARPEPPYRPDPALMARGQQFFARYPLEIGSALFCGSLPESYASPRGARVLVLTGRLVSGTVRRVAETAQMLLDAMTVDGLDPERGAGYQDLRRIRLMHAAVRNFIETDPSVPHTSFLPTPAHGWCDGWGRPLNQEDLLGGLLTFTVSVFEVFEKLGIEVDDDDLEAYLHRWKVIGSLLGILPEILPVDVAEAQEMAALIRYRQLGASNDGRELTTALLSALADGVPLPPLRGLVPATMRWYVGGDTAAMIGVGTSPWSLFLEGPAKVVSDVAHVKGHHDLVVQSFIRRLGSAAINKFMSDNASRGADRANFAIPEELAASVASGPRVFKLL